MENANTTLDSPSLFRGSGTGTMCNAAYRGVSLRASCGSRARTAPFRLAIVRQRSTYLVAGIAASI
jgi:hypothetical protein